MIELYNGDCLEVMKNIPDNSIDLILCDPPYGTTSCSWDAVIPLDKMWEQLNRVIKDNRAIVLFGGQPFTSILVSSNLKNFKYEWIYKKKVASNFGCAKYQPMKEHENILVFSNGTHAYFPIMEERSGSGKERVKYSFQNKVETSVVKEFAGEGRRTQKELRYPSSVREYNNRGKGDTGSHPTQKPVGLMEYLIKTYSKEGDTILDFTMGSGTTGVACKNLNRNFIGIEMNEDYFKIAEERINDNCSTK